MYIVKFLINYLVSDSKKSIHLAAIVETTEKSEGPTTEKCVLAGWHPFCQREVRELDKL